jgi:hypothetical protein
MDFKKINQTTCHLFALILAISVMVGKSHQNVFYPKNPFLTHYNKKNLINTFITSRNQFINLKNPKNDQKYEIKLS